jgi:hypothetical protein
VETRPDPYLGLSAAQGPALAKPLQVLNLAEFGGQLGEDAG